MKTSILFLLVCFVSFFSTDPLLAQTIPRSVLGANGQSSIDQSNQLEWTVGEMAVDYFKNMTTLSSGFHQGYLSFPTSTKKKFPVIDVEIFPNPFFEEIYIRSKDFNPTLIRIIDVAGREMFRFHETNHSGKLVLSKLSPGAYFLEITQNNGPIHLEKIIKI